MIWLLITLILFVICLLLGIGRAMDRNEPREIREERLRPIATSVPYPSPAHIVESWAKYDVPLDDGLQQYIAEVCREYEVDAAVVFAIMAVESDFDAGYIGDGGASYGLMQIYASQHTERCIRLNCYNLLDPRQNVLCGVDYLAELLGAGHGIEWALSWYNGHGGETCDYAYFVLTEADRLLESVQVQVR